MVIEQKLNDLVQNQSTASKAILDGFGTLQEKSNSIGEEQSVNSMAISDGFLMLDQKVNDIAKKQSTVMEENQSVLEDMLVYATKLLRMEVRREHDMRFCK